MVMLDKNFQIKANCCKGKCQCKSSEFGKKFKQLKTGLGKGVMANIIMTDRVRCFVMKKTSPHIKIRWHWGFCDERPHFYS